MARRDHQMNRRQLLARMGITTVGASGLLFTLRHGAIIGAVTPRAHAGGKDAGAVRVNFGPPQPDGLGFVAAFVVTRGSAAALVDAGLPDSADAIGTVLEATGKSWRDVQHVILTHYHLDHSGSTAEVLRRAPQATLWMGAADMPLLEQSPFPIPEATRLRQTARAAADGADIFGLRVVATPGHTPGHISLLDPELGALFVGDTVLNGPVDVSAFFPEVGNLNPGGGLGVAGVPFDDDPEQNVASIRRLGAQPFETAFFSHGPPLASGAPAAFRQLADRLSR